MKQKLSILINSYSDIFFLQGNVSGFLLLLITFFNPNVAIAGLIAVLSAYTFATFTGFKETFLKSGFYTYNPLLIGFSIGASFKLIPITFIVIITASILSFVITTVLSHLFSTFLKLPVLSLPFVTVSSLVFLAAGQFSRLYIQGHYQLNPTSDWIELPLWLAGFLKALGNIVFMPHIIPGLLIALLILFHSRILFCLGLCSFLAGTWLQGFFSGSYETALLEMSSFNYILIGMALGGIYLVPVMQSWILALIGVAVSSILISAVHVFWAQYGIPVFTLPFIIVTLSFTYMINLSQYRYKPFVFKPTPEESLDHFLTAEKRFPKGILIDFPFLEPWTLWQGFNGQWTHKGKWSHACDFVITTPTGETFIEDGTRLAHYGCFHKAVLSPIRGTVIQVVNHLPDQVIGSVDTVNNWGNCIMIQHLSGYIVKLAHFAQYSIVVKEGDWVESKTYLGLCGNSGYSPQPHLHLHVQENSSISAQTLPFNFSSHTMDGQFYSFGLPKEKSPIQPAYTLPFYDQVTTFLLGTTLHFDVFDNDHFKEKISLYVGMAADGSFYLESKKAKVYFGKQNHQFMLYQIEGKDTYLSMIYLAFSSCPLMFEENLTWTDIIPVHLSSGFLETFILTWLKLVLPHKFHGKGVYTFKSGNEIHGKIQTAFFNRHHHTSIILDPYKTISYVRVDTIELRRIDL